MRLEPPSPIATVQITAAIPIVIPSIVSAVRNLFRASAESATGRTVDKSMPPTAYPRAAAQEFMESFILLP
jgi:hypothetical protein